jgi:cell division protein FtsQ
MSKVTKYTLLSLCGALLVFCIACAFVAGTSVRKDLKCTRLDVRIVDSLENSFVSRADVKKFLDREYGTYIGMPLDSLDLVKMEDIIDSRSAVMKSQAYVTKDGTLHLDVTQRSPVVRFQKKDGGFYADAEGYIFPLQNSYASHVQVIDGNIPLAANSGYKGSISDKKEMEWFRRMMDLVNYIETSRTWKDKIVQIHVADNGDVALIPRKGNEMFIIGKPTALEEKFEKMGKYYKVIIPEKGSDAYRIVDLRYRGQIVCK